MANDKLMLILMLAAEIHQRQGLIGDGQNRISAAKDPKALASSVAATDKARYEACFGWRLGLRRSGLADRGSQEQGCRLKAPA
jgi:hypothetical protein